MDFSETQAKNMKGKNLQCCGLVTELRKGITETKELFCVGASFPSVTPPIVWDQGNFYLIIFFFSPDSCRSPNFIKK